MNFHEQYRLAKTPEAKRDVCVAAILAIRREPKTSAPGYKKVQMQQAMHWIRRGALTGSRFADAVCATLSGDAPVPNFVLTAEDLRRTRWSHSTDWRAVAGAVAALHPEVVE